jgi:hypothetical protein
MIFKKVINDYSVFIQIIPDNNELYLFILFNQLINPICP